MLILNTPSYQSANQLPMNASAPTLAGAPGGHVFPLQQPTGLLTAGLKVYCADCRLPACTSASSWGGAAWPASASGLS